MRLFPKLKNKKQRMRKAGEYRPHWSEVDIARVVSMRAAGATVAEIAEALGRTTSAVVAKLHYARGPSEAAMHRPSERMLTARLARQEAGNRQDLTGALFGDPPPGYSALDRKALSDSCGSSRKQI